MVEPFEGGFSAYVMQRVERDRLAALAEQKRQNELRRELAWLSRGARARATKPKFHVAAAQALIADVPPLRDELAAQAHGHGAPWQAGGGPGARHGALRGHRTVPARTVLDDVDWIVGPGDRYGIVGEQRRGQDHAAARDPGLADAWSAGRVKIGQTVRFAVLSQHLDDLCALRATIACAR